MTEASGRITLNPPTAIKQGSVGKPFKIDLAIVKDNQLTKQAMQTGEVALRGPQVITDYLQPSPSSFKDGWLLTGDIGHLDEDGLKDGKKILSTEVARKSVLSLSRTCWHSSISSKMLLS